MGKKIRYHSFDFDGSLSNEAFYKKLDGSRKDQSKTWTEQLTEEQANQAIIEANEDFLNHIISTRGDSEDYVIVGSNRQDVIMDFHNGTNGRPPPGSVFPRISAIAQKLSAKLDTFLLADAESGQDFGTEFKTIGFSELLHVNGSYKSDVRLNTIDEDNRFAKLVDDSSKISLLFAQIQKASMEHPNDEIEFNFHDDRKDIVEGIQRFFTQYPELVPKNVVLNLRGYSGPQPEKAGPSRTATVYPYGAAQHIATINGKGIIPKVADDWTTFYKQMRAQVISESKEDAPSHINIAEQFTPDKLLEYYKKEAKSLDQIPQLAQEYLTMPLKKLSVAARHGYAEGSLELQLLANDVKHSKAIGRVHELSVSAAGYQIKEELQHLKGDHLKREILLDFKSQIEKITSLDDLEDFVKQNIQNKSDAFKILAKGQGITTKVLNLETDSVKALKSMINPIFRSKFLILNSLKYS